MSSKTKCKERGKEERSFDNGRGYILYNHEGLARESLPKFECTVNRLN